MHKVGWHLNNAASVNQGGWNVLNAVPPAAVLNIPGGGTVEDIARILEISPNCHVFIRPYYPPEDNEASKGTYIENVESMIRGGHWNIIPVGQRHLQLFNEQNMPRHSQYEGFGVNLADMISFDKWFCIGYDRIKNADPTWKIGWTPLTPGNMDVYFRGTEPKNVPYYMHGLEAAKDNPTPEEIRRAIENGPCYQSLMKADEYLCHIYSMNPADEIDKDWCGLRFVVYAGYFPKSMDVWITECGISGGPSHSEPWWPVRWYTILQAYPAVKGTCWWRLGHEVQGVDPIVGALRTYVNDLPPDPPQPIPWPDISPPEPPSVPVPDFVGQPLSGVAPFEVQFTNLSPAADSCRWWFFDYEQSTSWHSSHLYENPGTYDVLLRLWQYPNEEGEYVDELKENYVTVLDEEPPEPPENWEEAIRNEVRTRMGLSYSPESLFVDYARSHDLGAQLTDTFEVTVGEQTLDVQAFSEGIVVVTVIELPPEPEVSHIEH